MALQVLQLSRAFTDLPPPSSASVFAQSNLQLWDGTPETPEMQIKVMLKSFSHLAGVWSAPEPDSRVRFIVDMETE